MRLGLGDFRPRYSTPIDARRKLVVRGLYRYVRNPIYTGWLAVILGWAMLFGATDNAWRLATGHSLHLFRIPGPFHRDL